MVFNFSTLSIFTAKLKRCRNLPFYSKLVSRPDWSEVCDSPCKWRRTAREASSLSRRHCQFIYAIYTVYCLSASSLQSRKALYKNVGPMLTVRLDVDAGSVRSVLYIRRIQRGVWSHLLTVCSIVIFVTSMVQQLSLTLFPLGLKAWNLAQKLVIWC